MSKEKGYFSFFFFVSISSGARTIDFHNVFGYVNKLVDESLAVHLGQDAALVVIPALTMRERENVVYNWVFFVSFIFLDLICQVLSGRIVRGRRREKRTSMLCPWSRSSCRVCSCGDPITWKRP